MSEETTGKEMEEAGDSLGVRAETLALSLLHPNKGQIPGLPKNPRFIRDDKFRRLCASLREDPEMAELREPIVCPLPAGGFVVVAGNMRVRAMRENGAARCLCKILPADTPPVRLRAYAAKDNINYGEWDFDIMANEWDEEDVAAAGIDIPDMEPAEEGKKGGKMSFTLTTAQAAVVMEALAMARKAVRESGDAPEFDNANANANAFFYAIQQTEGRHETV